MRTKIDQAADLMRLIGMIMNKITTLEKLPRDFGTGDKLFPSEIHTIEAIGQQPGINMTDLASVLGISKPAVAQIVGKVVKKKLVERYNGSHNRKEVRARLTEKGESAFRRHQEFHARMNAVFLDRLRRLKSREFDVLSELARDMASYFDQVLEEREPEVSLGQAPLKNSGQGRPRQ
jgi:DNA-binding MarR family transcriptional regulator